MTRIPVALTLAGSDSGGGAGIQADLKTFNALKVHGATVVTCLTAQNPRQVLGIYPCTPSFVRLQLDALLQELKPQAAKTGMLYSAGIIREVCAFWKDHPDIPLVVDPVMISTSGSRLLKPSAETLMQDRLLPLAALVTPNLDEAEFLLRSRIRTEEDLAASAREIYRRWGCPALVKGGHLRKNSEAVDVFYDGQVENRLRAPFVKGVSTHGTGCTYSAAIAAQLALGTPLRRAVALAKDYVTQAIRDSVRIGGHYALGVGGP
jgi:hydroxymethylpyrimidine/phosphomethylpyrimidine kinase